MRITLFCTLLILEVFYHYWLLSGGYWDVSFALPLQVCSISLILCLILLATNSPTMFQIVYFLGLAGAFQAILTPELFLGFPHFRFFQFFITHMAIVWTGLFYVAVMKYRPTFKGLLLSFGFLNVSAAVAYIGNRLTGGNYMFLSFKPTNASLIDYLGPYPYYIISLELIAFGLFLLLYLPFFLKRRAEDAMKRRSNS